MKAALTPEEFTLFWRLTVKAAKALATVEFATEEARTAATVEAVEALLGEEET